MGREFMFDNEFEKLYNYDGELGVIYSQDKSKFILWAPTAEEVKLVLYGNNGYDYSCEEKQNYDMKKGKNGTWIIEVNKNLNGHYYNYLVKIEGKVNEVVDPYARAVGVNGNRGMIIDLKTTNPEGWETDKRPELKSITDSIIGSYKGFDYR